MKNQIKKMLKSAALLLVMTLLLGTMSATAEEGASSDDSLDSLGITTEGYTIDPEFYYSIIEYNVTVPGGTPELTLDPVTSNEYATVVDISGTEIVDGSTTVSITVEAEDGSTCTYYLYVTVDPDAEAVGTAAEVETEAQTEKQTVAETETETEDSRYVSVDRDTLEEAENTIAVLKEETSSYRDRVNLLMIILYALIAICVILLFIVINLLLRRRDMKAELKSYRDAGYTQMPENKDNSRKKRRGKKAEEYSGYDPYYGQQMNGGQMNGGQMPGQMNGPQNQMNGMPGQQVQTPQSPQMPPQMNDDPSTVPKPEDAQTQPRKMPGYEQPQPDFQYEPPKEGDKKKSDVDVDMIDL